MATVNGIVSIVVCSRKALEPFNHPYIAPSLSPCRSFADRAAPTGSFADAGSEVGRVAWTWRADGVEGSGVGASSGLLEVFKIENLPRPAKYA